MRHDQPPTRPRLGVVGIFLNAASIALVAFMQVWRGRDQNYILERATFVGGPLNGTEMNMFCVKTFVQTDGVYRPRPENGCASPRAYEWETFDD